MNELPTLLTRAQLKERLAVGDALLFTVLKTDPDFPKPVRIGRNTPRWIEAEVHGYLAERLAERAADRSSLAKVREAERAMP